jgi:hypothetical protein
MTKVKKAPYSFGFDFLAGLRKNLCAQMQGECRHFAIAEKGAAHEIDNSCAIIFICAAS